MKRLTRAQTETVVHELSVAAFRGTFKYLVSAISLIFDKRLSQVFHVYPYLMSTTGFQTTLHE